MILRNNQYPNGIVLKPAPKVKEAPCHVRKMTEEEWERYGRDIAPSSRFKPCISDYTDSIAFGKRVRAERTARGISQNALAKAIGVSNATISNTETARYVLNKETAEKLIRFFGWE